MKHYDVMVIGSGGGSKISTPSAKLGLKVALVEKGPLGGTCLNRGCIPSKMLIHAAEVAKNFHESNKFHITSKGFEVNFEELVSTVSTTIDTESQSINPHVEANENIDFYPYEGKFVGIKQLEVNGEVISADKIFIVAGARPFIPDLEGINESGYITSTEALRLTKQPKKLIVLGGGFIATELAYYYSQLGTQVDIWVRSSMLRPEDGEVKAEFEKTFAKTHNITLHFSDGSKPVISKNGDQKVMTFTNREGNQVVLEGDQLLVAAGVLPNTEALDLAKTGVELNNYNYIKVDDHLRTSQEGIWAFGDIAGNFLLRHSANFEGEYLLETVIYGENKRAIDYLAMPHAVFTDPQIAAAGYTEEQLKQSGTDYVVGFNTYAASAMGMALKSDSGFVKLLVEKSTRKILGVHIIGFEASVLVHEVLPIMRMGGKLDDILNTIHIHPALSELVRNAARKARNALIEAGIELPLYLKLK